MIGKTVSHYKILEKLGEGGMGVVYKAEDTQLKRYVALKFLPPELTRDEDARERFTQEAQAASALDHANINTIYEIGQTDDGRMFIAMAYYEGETLRERLKSGAVSPRAAIDFALQIVRGLARAHESGIVHRDVKAANVMVTTRGEVKILDFGLAKLAGQVGITKTGTTVGTVAYMSPEQARGEEVDHRTDIWSLGVLLYEMSAGTRPFRGEHEQAVVYSILNEDPEPATQLRPELPRELQQIIDKALAKSPAERYQNAEELAKDLDYAKRIVGGADAPSFSVSRKSTKAEPKRVLGLVVASVFVLALAVFVYVTRFRNTSEPQATATEPSTKGAATAIDYDRSVVVLPFEDISPSGDNEYFSDGLTDEIIADLSKVHSLRVISRTSAMTLKGTDLDVKEIGEKLDVRYVLEGSVRKAREDLKITAQLIDASVDAHVWTEEYDGTLDDVFDMQEKVSRAIVNALEVELSVSEDQVLAERPLEDVRAYELYLRALDKTRQMSEEALDSAIDDLQRGLEIVGDNALLYAAMGYAYWQYANIGARSYDEVVGKVEECVEKLFELEPESPDGYMLLYRLEIHRGNTIGQVEYLKKTLELDPANTDALISLAMTYACHAKTDVTRQIFEQVERYDPLTPGLPIVEGYLHLLEGRFDLVTEVLDSAQGAYVADIPKRLLYAVTFICTHRPDDARRVVESLEEDISGSYFARSMRLLLDAYEGKQASVEAIMTPEFAAATRQDYQYSTIVAGAYAAMGDKVKALDWLENAIDRGFNNYIYMSRYDPLLANLRDDERFQALMKRAKARCDEFEALN